MLPWFSNGKFPLYLAPMAGVSDKIFRQLCKERGADVLVTEFVSAEGVFRRNERTRGYLEFDASERPIGVQLFGGNAERGLGCDRASGGGRFHPGDRKWRSFQRSRGRETQSRFRDHRGHDRTRREGGLQSHQSERGCALFLRRKLFGMTDYFALFDEARRPWLDPEKLKQKYFARSRASRADAELNEGFRVLSDPKLRLHHLLVLEGAELTAGRPVPPRVAELFWNTGTLLREVERWLLKNAEAGSALSRALLSSEKTKLQTELNKLEEGLNALYETELAQLRQVDAVIDTASPNELLKLIERYDSISYLGRLQEQTKEKRFQMSVA